MNDEDYSRLVFGRHDVDDGYDDDKYANNNDVDIENDDDDHDDDDFDYGGQLKTTTAKCDDDDNDYTTIEASATHGYSILHYIVDNNTLF